jgi:hypothetical protein
MRSTNETNGALQRRPTAGTLKLTSLFLTKTQLADLRQLGKQVGSNMTQLIRDFINEGLERRKRAARKEME